MKFALGQAVPRTEDPRLLTGEDWTAENFGAPRPVIPRQRRDGSAMFVPPRPALAKDRTMLVGDPVAFVVTESVDLAKDAAERIAVEYEPLPSVTSTEEALSSDALKLWAECRDNE